jgi:aryl-alcohol dehydrogenase-like predicted oxidoreductase
MQTRPLGRTGLTVSALGFGCGAIGGLMTKGEPSEQTRAAARALEAGITYFDTARSYGDGRSEENLGRVLQELNAWDRVVVGTKFRVEPEEVGDAAGAIRRSLEGSLGRLRHDWVHVFQLHNMVTNQPGRGLTPDQVLGPVLDGLEKVRADGLIGHIGITATGDTEAVTRVVTSGRFESAQVYFNALNPSAGYAGKIDPGDQDFAGLIDKAKAAGMGVINIRPLAAGAVSARPERHANAGDPGRFGMAGITYSDDLARAQSLADLSGTLGMESPVETALRFVLAKDGVSTVIVGYSEMAQLEDAIRWAERGALAPDEVERLLSLRGES